MASIETFLAKRLKLKVNKAKSAVSKPSVRKFRASASRTGSNNPGAASRRRHSPVSKQESGN
jgi:RNA-directed DNA polymerase